MKKSVLFVLLFLGLNVHSAHTAEISREVASFYDNYLAGNMQIGTRSVYRKLTDSDSGNKYETYGNGTFLGTIYALKEVQEPLPSNIFLKYFLGSYLGVELAWDKITAETRATTPGHRSTKSDGDVILSGPALSIIGRFPITNYLIPYASFGLGFYSGDFNETNHWKLGYRTPQDYVRDGSPSESPNGVLHVMSVKDTVGVLFSAGCTYSLTANWLLDLSVQYTSVDPKATFYGYSDGELTINQPGHFPLDNFAVRLGVAYQF